MKMVLLNYRITTELLNESPDSFPVGQGVDVIGGKTISKTRNWWKAILLVKTRFGSREQHQIRLYGWQKNKNDEYKLRQKYNISATASIGYLIDVLQMFTEESGKGMVLDKIYETFISRINELEREKDWLSTQISNLPNLSKRIEEYDRLLNKPGVTETEMHNYLKKNTWMFGTHYSKMIHSEKYITLRSRNDFILKKFGIHFDILELKSPTAKLFVNVRGNKKAQSRELKDAISQMMVYLSHARMYYLSIKSQTGLDIFLPKGIILIGRRSDEDIEFIKIHNEFLHHIEIWTYDDLKDCANETINTYQRETTL